MKALSPFVVVSLGLLGLSVVCPGQTPHDLYIAKVRADQKAAADKIAADKEAREAEIVRRIQFAMEELEDPSLVYKYGPQTVATVYYEQALKQQRKREVEDEIRIRQYMAKGLSRENAVLVVANENIAAKQAKAQAQLAAQSAEDAELQRQQVEELRKLNNELNTQNFYLMMEDLRRAEAQRQAAMRK